MQLKSLTYTSMASLDLTSDDILAIHRTARELNALDGITGLLIFNGTHFLQIIEGVPEAIDGLLERLRRDRRHHGVEVRDIRFIEDRCFPSWSMELIRVTSRYFEAKDAIVQVLPERLPEPVIERVLKMTESISGNVELND
jgi:hypothetical protein